MITPTVEQCEQLLREEIDKINAIPIEERSSQDYLIRNLLFYGFLLYSQRGYVEIATLVDIIGRSLQLLVENQLRQLHFKGYARLINDNRDVVFPENMLIAVRKVFDDPNMDYNLSHPVPCFQGLTGEELVSYISGIKTLEVGSIAGLVANALKHALGGFISVSRLEELAEVEAAIRFVDEDILEATRLLSPFNDHWHTILAVYPQLKALDSQLVNRLTSFLPYIRSNLQAANPTKYSNLYILLITCAIDLERDVKRLSHHPQFHYTWSLSALRFFNLIGRMTTEYIGYEKIIAEEFPAIFSIHKSMALSARESITVLKEAIEAKKNRTS